MKTVTGKVISSEPISVAKAASILTKFASSENGATQAISAYLRRASAAFNELKGLHRDLKASSLKEKKPRSDVTLERNPTRGSDVTLERNQTRGSDDVSRGTYNGIQKRKHKKKEKESDGVGELVENDEDIDGGESEPIPERELVSQGPSQYGDSEIKQGKNKKKKKKKNREDHDNVDNGELTTKFEAEEEHRKEVEVEKKKNKKKRKSDGDMGSEEKKSKKKRKVKELDN